MATETEPTLRRAPHPAQFRLAGLLLLVFSVALGFSALRPDRTNWDEAYLTSLLFWILLGLEYQVADLWSALDRRDGLTVEERWGWRFAITWRLVVGITLAGAWMLQVLQTRGLLEVPISDWLDAWTAMLAHRAVVCFSLVIVLASVARPVVLRRDPWWSRSVEGLGWLAAAVLGIVLLTHQMAVPFLVHLATVGIAQAAPLGSPLADCDPLALNRPNPFSTLSVLAVGLFLLNLLGIRQLSKAWQCRQRRLWLWGGLLVIGLIASACYLVWVVVVGLPKLSPFMAEALVWKSLYAYCAGLLLLLFLVTAIAYRMTRLLDDVPVSPERSWRRQPRSYYHERMPVLALLAILLPARLAVGLYRPGTVARVAGILVEKYGGVWEECLNPFFQLQAIVFLAGVATLWAAWQRRRETSASDPPALPLGRFLTVWISLLLTILLGLPALAGAGFSLWLTRWYGLLDLVGTGQTPL